MENEPNKGPLISGLSASISVLALILVFAHMLFPGLAIDNITLGLLAIALLPEIVSYLRRDRHGKGGDS